MSSKLNFVFFFFGTKDVINPKYSLIQPAYILGFTVTPINYVSE